MTETLQEFCDSRGVRMRVDARAGVIRGVKILGPTSRNGRIYPPETLAQAAALYEEAKVNVNHPQGNPTGPRDYQDRLGTIRNVQARKEEGLFADLHFNPKHALAEQLIWDAEHAPQNVGFSHNVQARTARRGDHLVVEAITRVQSVDLVADPATTAGLFESHGDDTPSSTLSVDDLRRDHPELIEQICREQTEELQSLRAAEASRQKRALITRLLEEHQLPAADSTDLRSRSIVSEQFLATLLAAEDESALRTLIEERAELVRTLAREEPTSDPQAHRPISRDQQLAGLFGPINTQGFLEAIT